ncbi:MAG: thioredoxin domain-containing protein [Proteobacteria bacterium]|jgi:protein-disulfide isomerase|nr:thioredoxin domain-containing protein [Pseudomonadota bacterium]
MFRKLSLGVVLCSISISLSCAQNSQCADTPKVASVASAAGNDEVLVTINGEAVTESTFDKELTGREKGAIIKAKSELYEAKKGVLEEFVFNKLIETEAKKKNVSTEEYMKSEVDGKIKAVKDKEVDDFYKNVKLQYEKNGKVAPPLNDAVKGQIKQQLTMKATMERREALNAELLKKNKVVYSIQQPRMEVEKGNLPVKGSERAPITIVEFSDFQCPYCKKGSDTMKEVAKKYGSKVQYYFRDFPLSFHDRGKPAANAARCAAEQGKFWQYHDKLFEDQKKLTDEDFIALGKSLKLDMAKFEPCVKESKHMSDVEKDMRDGENAGVSGTPAYFINGIFLSGALPIKKFEEIIEAELKQ